MNKYVKSDNQDGYTNLKLAVGGAFSDVVSTGEEVQLHHICPLIVIDFLNGNNLNYNQSLIARGRGQYNIRFEVSYSTPIVIEVDMMSGNTNIRRM
jgi:hypothetical protein